MIERSRLFDDFAGVAGGAFSAIAGIGDELGALARARIDEALAALLLVRREEFDALSELAAVSRDSQEAASARIAMLESRVADLEARQGRRSYVPADAELIAPDHHQADGAPGGPPPRAASSEALPPAV